MCRIVTAYTRVAKCLHWAMALLIIALLIVGHVMGALPKGEWRSGFYDIHKAVGVVVFALLIGRLVWRLIKGAPQLPAAMGRLERLAAQGGHVLLYILMAAMPLSGFAMSQTGGHPVAMAGLALPVVFAKDEALSKLFQNIHGTLGWGLVVLLLVHVGAALRHHFVLKDDVLRRMLPDRAG